LLNQVQANFDYQLKEVIYDRGGKGQKQIGTTKISTPDYRPLKRDTEYQRRQFRLGQNYLSGSSSPQINAFLAATGWNLKKMMKKLKEENQKLLFAPFKSILNLLFPKNKLIW